ncbi:phosphoribosyltransferase-like protein [Achromobacter sp. NCFB-sbj8-Ac1-l]|uniref:phosphoribosyltransferase-like protein n=1 Tax=unclassified Achromobacter TaxID=2626865 RepID=UPI004046BE45
MSKSEAATAVAEAISKFEQSLTALDPNTATEKELDAARALLVTAICTVCGFSQLQGGAHLEQAIIRLEAASEGKREATILLVRSLSISGLLPVEAQQSRFSRCLPALVEEVAPDIARHCKLQDKKQNYEKISLLRGFHGQICSSLSLLRELPNDLVEINNIRSQISKALSTKSYQGYLQPFNFVAIRAKAEAIIYQVERLVQCKDSGFKSFFDELVDDICDMTTLCNKHRSFLTDDFIRPFVMAVHKGVGELESSAAHRFKCDIAPKRRSIKAAEKKYPLHEADRYVVFNIPMVNHGPGIAIDVTVEVDCGEKNSAVLLDSEELSLGDVPPGEFALSVRACIVEPTSSVKMTIQIEWHQLFGDRESVVFNVEIDAQDPSVDWTVLESLEPYSLEVAEGDMFVGRVAKVKTIGNKLLKRPMASTYITGQKRIGKTSLAYAVSEYVRGADSAHEYSFLYLEYGEYCAASPESTVKALGNSVFSFLRGFLPHGLHIADADFSESLAPLNSLARLLENNAPTKRFVVILDEFDEIHPEMYRMGALAETFFANLRTLAARSNLAFVLVGGEKMPFIIGAQGDQLNKFVREPLDFFDRSLEWQEYCELISKPVSGLLNWDDAALSELYNFTNGHPYYTKLLCAKIVLNAVRERDTEIISSDVRYALNTLVEELDTNAFAHMWKDGINAEREETEVTELKRLRLLVALGRALRGGERSISSVIKTAPSIRLTEGEVAPLVDDFIRRDILRDRDGALTASVPLFERWLIEVGVSKLISSTLADDLEVELERAAKASFVGGAEIQQLTDNWPLYRARKVGPEDVRAWLDQVPSPQDQRLLFKLLQKMRFLSPDEIEEKLINAHGRFVRPIVGAMQMERKTDKRRDIWITYFNGVGKSGVQYARYYAKVNSISTECILEPAAIERRLKNLTEGGWEKPKAIVIIDDFVGSGRTLADGAVDFSELCGALLVNLSIPLLAVVIVGTEDGERRVNSVIEQKTNLPLKLYVCEYLLQSNYAFLNHELGFWENEEEKMRAKALCLTLGTGLYKEPLGFGGKGLLMTFPDTCPNNSLPILYRSRSHPTSWRALFPRPVS